MEKVKPQAKRSKAEIIFSLMCSSGMMLIIAAIPEGIVMGLQGYGQFHLQLRDALFLLVVMTLLMALTGIILFQLGLHLIRRLKAARPK